MSMTRGFDGLPRALEVHAGTVTPLGRGVTQYRFPWVDGMSPMDIRTVLLLLGLPDSIRIHRDSTTDELVLVIPLDDAGLYQDTVVTVVAGDLTLAPGRVADAAAAAAAYGGPDDTVLGYSLALESM